ncbi:hypothetical protein BC008_41840 [Mastigocoleus testarum BC008]|uniref:AAA+ ATPase domain-containing protein n=1 Tax=Mastigocoleus testarum BC008 TaxID=371196 RepID=A0A0V7ZMV4_9CYAN|nr:hypothetical protein BC008_41840 [Mastigocoleus testarum BC008]
MQDTNICEGKNDLLNRNFPAPPPWRKFHKINKEEQKEINQRWDDIQELAESEENTRGRKRGQNYRIYVDQASLDGEEITDAAREVLNAVNAALYLRRPVLVTGNPGSGKTSLAYAIAYELNLGPVLAWSITARSTLQDGLYRYDAIGRLQDAEKNGRLQDLEKNHREQSIGNYITLGALGTAFLPSKFPRVLLIDEIDKSDINLPNDLLHIFEEGAFKIPELVRRVKDTEKETNTEKVFTSDGEIKATIRRGKVLCAEFPIVVMTSNGEREFPPAFLRRCLRVRMPDPQGEALKSIVKAHFGEEEFKKTEVEISKLIEYFEEKEGERSPDQLLNAIHLLTNHISLEALDKNGLKDLLFKSLSISEEL